ncbi:MAG: transporter substrate-binding domain-containing protein [Holdemania massiliensis]
MKQRGLDKYKVLDDNFGTEQYAVGMRKSDATLLSKINEAMQACIEDGTQAALNAKWFGE